jgi:hypothetical protein
LQGKREHHTGIFTMLTPLGTKEDGSKSSTEYYHTQQQQQQNHYYYPRPLNDDSNNLHHYHPSIYETNQYYALTPTYSHQQIHNHVNEEDANNQVSSTVYLQSYPHHQRYSPVESVTEMLYSQNLSEQPITPQVYDYNLSPAPPVSSNLMFHQQSNYIQPSIEQTSDSTSNNSGYPIPYVSSVFIYLYIFLIYFIL